MLTLLYSRNGNPAGHWHISIDNVWNRLDHLPSHSKELFAWMKKWLRLQLRGYLFNYINLIVGIRRIICQQISVCWLICRWVSCTWSQFCTDIRAWSVNTLLWPIMIRAEASTWSFVNGGTTLFPNEVKCDTKFLFIVFQSFTAFY
jgi:hypothetical protein